jgi:hypothetical protein
MSKQVKAKLCRSGINWRATIMFIIAVVTICVVALVASEIVSVTEAVFLGVGAGFCAVGVIALLDRWEMQRIRSIGMLTPYEEPEEKKQW